MIRRRRIASAKVADGWLCGAGRFSGSSGSGDPGAVSSASLSRSRRLSEPERVERMADQLAREAVDAVPPKIVNFLAGEIENRCAVHDAGTVSSGIEYVSAHQTSPFGAPGEVLPAAVCQVAARPFASSSARRFKSHCRRTASLSRPTSRLKILRFSRRMWSSRSSIWGTRSSRWPQTLAV